MGTYRIAQHLTNQGLLTRNGVQWSSSSISHILKNSVYTGIRKFGSSQSDIIQHLQIVDTDTFWRAQRQIDKNKLSKPRGTHSEHASSTLFADVLYCMFCGKKMTVTRNNKVRQNKNGSQATYTRINYICINKSSIDFCAGQKSFSVRIIDKLFSGIINSCLLSIDKNYLSLLGANNDLDKEIKDLKVALGFENKTLSVLQREAVEAMLGTSAFLPVLITDLITNSKNKISEYERKIAIICDIERVQKVKMNRFIEIHKQLSADNSVTFSSLSFGSKQEIIEQLIERLYIGRRYKYRIEWTFSGYCEGEIDTNQY